MYAVRQPLEGFFVSRPGGTLASVPLRGALSGPRYQGEERRGSSSAVVTVLCGFVLSLVLQLLRRLK